MSILIKEIEMNKKLTKVIINRLETLRSSIDCLPLESLENTNYMIDWLEKLSVELESIQERLEVY